MKQNLHKTGAIFMALLLMFSTLSFSMDMHYCGDHLVDFSLFKKAESCGMMASSDDAPGDCALVKSGMDCCTDVQILVEGQDDFKVSFDQLTENQQLFLSAFVFSYVNLLEGVDDTSPKVWEYSPPPLIRDIQVLHQIFLI